MATVEIASTSTSYYLGGSSTAYATAQTTCTQHSGGLYMGQIKSGSTYSIYRGFLRFDTSSLSGLTVTGVAMKLSCPTDVSSTDFDLEIIKCDWSPYYPIDNGNKGDAYSLARSSSVDGTWRNTSGMSTNAYYTSEALDPSWVVTAGITYYALRSSRDVSETAPTGNEYIRIVGPGESPNPAVLVVEYTEGGGSSTPIHLIRTGMQPGMRIGL